VIWPLRAARIPIVNKKARHYASPLPGLDWNDKRHIDHLVPVVEQLPGVPAHELPSGWLDDIDKKVDLLNETGLVVRDRRSKKPRLAVRAQRALEKRTPREIVSAAWYDRLVEIERLKIEARRQGPDLRQW
jgi:hypothetical protein